MKKRVYELGQRKKLDMRKEFFKMSHLKQTEWLTEYPTLFSSTDSLYPLTSPNVKFFGNVLTYNGASTPTGGVNAFSDLTLSVKVPYIISFSAGNISPSGDVDKGIGVGITNTNYNGVAAALYTAGAGWNDTIMFNNGTNGVCTLNVTGNNVALQTNVNFGSTNIIASAGIITIQEYYPGQIYATVTNSANVTLTPWTKITSPWQIYTETRCVIFGVYGQGLAQTYGASIVQTPSSLVSFNNNG